MTDQQRLAGQCVRIERGEKQGRLGNLLDCRELTIDRIELEAFKSFAEKTIITLSKGTGLKFIGGLNGDQATGTERRSAACRTQLRPSVLAQYSARSASTMSAWASA